MAETRRIMISLPNSLLEEVDVMVPVEYKNRSDFVIEAMRLYINEKKRMEVAEKMKEGYREMSQINLTLAEIGLEQDILDLVIYEARLMGREVL
ncbi:CopG family transcriptional regulator [Tissierella sp. MB52-C2]|jgi:CopG family transcriptional regulator/antitoxin EndoAI|uniref:CopG family ribbon-helix-helix protein n=1 Tax=Tissierella sp. MB52-C2 TaxID=3070999 RepID=UPI00280B7A05|nr:CopG family transcriptional regulator [Tissierella sp. MB52-C2]WMM23750.1 CopG family transcriptional regulator [Tissierella sp. MB52-C2]